ncbi:MAG: hypothetical protein KBB54_01510 [Candidatus Pacebacteria bacterium]|nr:hypothetical protein [Candidatus Paceibacterota bacterium]
MPANKIATKTSAHVTFSCLPLQRRGFTLFLSLIVSSLLLAIGVSLSTIILKQLVFSSSGSESQIAFYAADSGAECAIYWDRKGVDGNFVVDSIFATSSPETADIYCGTGLQGAQGPAQVGSFLKVNSDEPGGGESLSATTTFYVDFSDTENAACAKVTVAKWYDATSATPDKTRIDSRGYNVGLDDGAIDSAVCNFSDASRVVERAIQLDL